MYNVRRILYVVHCTVCITLHALYVVYSESTTYNTCDTVYEVHCISYTVRCMMCSISFVTAYHVHCTLYTIHCTLYSVQRILYNVQYIVYSVHIGADVHRHRDSGIYYSNKCIPPEITLISLTMFI